MNTHSDIHKRVRLLLQGKYAEAESLCLRVIDKEETRLGPDHPSIASQLNNLASVLEAQVRVVTVPPPRAS